MAQRATPPASRRMLSTPASISVKLARSEKNSFILTMGALISSSVLKEDFTRNILRWRYQMSDVRCQISISNSVVIVLSLRDDYARWGVSPTSSNQQNRHQRCPALRSSKE